jgi:hypothetical protein
MRGLRTAGLFLGVSLLSTGCVMTSFLLQPEQRLLVKNLMKELDAGQKQLEENFKQGRWDAFVRVAGEMADSARRLQGVQPKKEVEDFRIRSVELEHDLTLMAGEARLQNEQTIRTHLKNMQFTCDSCHRKFKEGRPW